MANQIRHVSMFNRSRDPNLGKIAIGVFLEQVTPRTQVRGRLVGPRCLYNTTVEVTYPLRESRQARSAEREPRIAVETIIPDPCYWEPATPFLYEGEVELWEDGRVVEQWPVCLGLREIKIGPSGLRINGRPMAIRGIAGERFTEEVLARLHGEGYNTVLISPGASEGFWLAADRLGFLVIERMDRIESLKVKVGQEDHASFFGYLLSGAPRVSDLTSYPTEYSPAANKNRLLGWDMTDNGQNNPPQGCAFVYIKSTSTLEQAYAMLPKLIQVDRLANDAPGAGVLGTVVVLDRLAACPTGVEA